MFTTWEGHRHPPRQLSAPACSGCPSCPRQGTVQENFHCSHTLQGKSHLCIPFLGIARPQSQFPQSCVCERFIYSQDQSIYFPAAE